MKIQFVTPTKMARPQYRVSHYSAADGSVFPANNSLPVWMQPGNDKFDGPPVSVRPTALTDVAKDYAEQRDHVQAAIKKLMKEREASDRAAFARATKAERQSLANNERPELAFSKGRRGWHDAPRNTVESDWTPPEWSKAALAAGQHFAAIRNGGQQAVWNPPARTSGLEDEDSRQRFGNTTGFSLKLR